MSEASMRLDGINTDTSLPRERPGVMLRTVIPKRAAFIADTAPLSESPLSAMFACVVTYMVGSCLLYTSDAADDTPC
eukprot:2944731-Amphidinium_carterae.1